MSRADDLIMAKMHAHHAEHAAHCDGGCFADVRATLDAARDVIADHLGRQTVTAAPSTVTINLSAGGDPDAVAESIRKVLAAEAGRPADDAEREPEDDKAPTRAELLERLDMTFRQLQVMVELVDLGMDDAARSAARTMRAADGLRHPADALKMDDADKVAGSRWVLWCASHTFASMLDAMGVQNFAQWAMTMPDGRKLDLTAQWQGKVSAVERLRAVTEERDAARAEMRDLRASMRPKPEDCKVDLDAIDKRHTRALGLDAPEPIIDSWCDVRPLILEVRRVLDLFAKERAVRLSYEEGITWETNCTNCASLLTACHEEYERAAQAMERAEKAEAALAAADSDFDEDDRDADAVTAVGAPCAYCGAEPGEDCAPTCDVVADRAGEG